MGSITPQMKHFLSAEKFAVIGKVITDPSRWDYKVAKWYKDRQLSVVPVRYGQGGGQVDGVDIIGDPTGISDLNKTSISIIIHPSKGLPILESLFPNDSQNGPYSVWFQPGTESEEIRRFISERGLADRVVLGGRCVLVDGDRGLGMVKEGKL